MPRLHPGGMHGEAWAQQRHTELTHMHLRMQSNMSMWALVAYESLQRRGEH